MAGLEYVGPAMSQTRHLANRAYLLSLMTQNISQSTVDSLVSAGFAPYATKAYVDTQDGLNATQAFVNSGDSTRLRYTQRNQLSGVAGLDATGRIPAARINVTTTQRYPNPYFSPAAPYWTQPSGSDVSASTNTTLFTYSQGVPAFSGNYRLMITGFIDMSSGADGVYPVVTVRLGSSTGPIIAQGVGQPESYLLGQTFDDFSSYTANTDLVDPPWKRFPASGSVNIRTNSAQEVFLNTPFADLSDHALRDDIAASTATDYQSVGLTIGNTAPNSGGSSPFHFLYGRAKADLTHYIRAAISNTSVVLQYKNASGGVKTLSPTVPLNTNKAVGDYFELWCGDAVTSPSTPLQYRFKFFQNNALLGTLDENRASGDLTLSDSTHRGWGFGMQAGNIFGGYLNPGSVTQVSVRDQPSSSAGIGTATNRSTAIIFPTPAGMAASISGAVTLYVCITPSTTGTTSAFLPTSPAFASPVPQLYIVPLPTT